MKKLCLLFGLLLLVSNVCYANAVDTNAKVNPDQVKAKAEKINKFDQKLGLTEEQKIKVRELRKEAYDKMLPIQKQIVAKRKELRELKASTDVKREEKINQIRKDLKDLGDKAKEIRQQNMKEFEAILTEEQLKTLKQMKKEGRKKYRKNHRPKFIPIMPLNK